MSRDVTAHRAWGRVLDLVYPPRCGGCDRRGEWFCEECRASIQPPNNEPHNIMYIKASWCAGAFEGPLREAIHRLKYENDRPLAAPLAGLVYKALQSSPAWPRLEAAQPSILPVPLHRDREQSRGYNQSKLLGGELSLATDWIVDESLRRTRPTHSQVGLSAEEREANVRDAFAWEGAQPPRAVLLIDDVFTTGATLRECVGVLCVAGVREIYIATVARAKAPG